ncbi:hypothetical protein [Aquimarina spongiae]|uniref:Uncharacterized protein n=1 Tax=Aquimarina spongiae TaxID=570521 RepID=A0A1M6FIP6_9FLAO|nr:hypothetical protein [Aquimarina spongiae]SHI97492.1 hypothetical protein SAMN04488508_104304 [Aquimarina spongiae]
MKSERRIIAAIFLALFCLMQLAEVHVFSHDGDDGDCQLCLISAEKINDGFLNTEEVNVPCIIVIPTDVVRSTYEQRYFTSTVKNTFLNKAPPIA